MRTFNVFRGFDRGPKALMFRTSNMAAARAVAKKHCNSVTPKITVRDVLGGLRAEYTFSNERQGEFGREGDVREQLTPGAV